MDRMREAAREKLEEEAIITPAQINVSNPVFASLLEEGYTQSTEPRQQPQCRLVSGATYSDPGHYFRVRHSR